MKLLWQEIFTKEIPFTDQSEQVWQAVRQTIEAVKSDDTTVEQRWLSRSSELNWYPYLEILNNAEIIDGIIRGEQEGYDAAIIGCYCDPGLHAARGVVDIPVVGLSESAMMAAQTVGAKFACVTVWEDYIPIMERNIRLYGWEQRTISRRPVRHFDLDWGNFISALKGDGDIIVEQFNEVAMSCVEDGADTVIAGCGYLGPALNLLGCRFVGKSRVPVIDCVSAAVVMAEALASLRQCTGLSPSRTGGSPYPAPPKKKLRQIRERFGFVDVAETDGGS